MLFNQEEFEHKIEEASLKKGLKLFLANKVELLNKTESNSFTFLIDEKFSGEILVQLKAEKVLDYTCFCKNKMYCEHLAAALFYLQKENLNFLKAKQKHVKSIVNTKNNKNTLLEKQINAVKLVLKPYLTIQKLKKEQISDIQNQLLLEKNTASVFNQVFNFNLAILLELPKLNYYNYSATENLLQLILNDSKSAIKIRYHKGFNDIEKNTFISAAYQSLKSQANFNTAAFCFFISRAAVLIKNKDDFKNLKLQIKKRKLNKNSLDPIDRKLIAELQLSIMEAKLAGKVYSLKNYEATIELPIALAELEFLQNKNTKGFKILHTYGEQIKQKNINMFLDFVDESLRFSKEKNNKSEEERFLAEKFIYGFTINEKELDYFYNIISANETEIKTNQLLIQLKTNSVFYTFDKIAVILFHQNRFDELSEAIKKEKNKFRLLHKVALKKFPKIDEKFVNLYAAHLAQAITEAKFPYFQEKLFNTAKLFLDKLPKDLLGVAIDNLRKKLVYDKYISDYITSNYPANF